MTSLMLKFVMNRSARRLFSSFKPKRTGDLDAGKQFTSDVLLYKNTDTNSMKYLLYFSGLNFFVWMVPGYLTMKNFDDMIEFSQRRKKFVQQGLVEEEWWESLVGWINEHKFITRLLLQSVAMIGFLFTAMFSIRNVRMMTLLKDGQTVKFRTWTVIPSEEKFIEHKIPLSNISALSSRNDDKSVYIRFKVKGQPLYYLVDKNRGEFFNTQVYDKTVGYSRVFK